MRYNRGAEGHVDMLDDRWCAHDDLASEPELGCPHACRLGAKNKPNGRTARPSDPGEQTDHPYGSCGGTPVVGFYHGASSERTCGGWVPVQGACNERVAIGDVQR